MAGTAQWKSVNFASILPSELTLILDTIDTLLSVVKTPLDAVSTILGIAKSLLFALGKFDPASILRGLVEDFKDNFLASGFYVLEMWDYPVYQMEPAGYGPDNTFDTFNTRGGTFADFVKVMADSFNDDGDPNRPTLTGSCAMLVLVLAKGSIEALHIVVEDGSIGQTQFENLAGSMQGAAYQIHRKRWGGAWGKLRRCAEQQPSDKVAYRVYRLQQAKRYFDQFDNEEMDIIPVPMDPDTGDRFFESLEPEEIVWEEDVAPILDSIEEAVSVSTYPDWNRATLKDIYPQLVEIIDNVVDAVIDLLPPSKTIIDQFVEIISAIDAKIKELESIIDQIDEFLERIKDLLNLTGFHGLFLTTSKGVADLRNQLLRASNPILEDNSILEGRGWFAGMAIVVGGDAMTPFQSLFGTLIS